MTVSNLAMVSANQVTFTATVASGAPTEPDGWSLDCFGNFFALNPGTIEITPCATPVVPAIISIVPPTFVAGQATAATINGTGFIPWPNTNSCQPSLLSMAAGAENVALTNVIVLSPTQITATVTPVATDPAEAATVTVSNYLYNGNGQTPPSNTVTATAPAQITPAPKVTLQRVDLMQIQATGTPAGGTFSLSTQVQSGTATDATVGFASGSTSTTNPTTLQLIEPANPSPNGSSSPGGLERITVNYTMSSKAKSDQFQVPTFGMSCYDTTLQSDWGTAPNNCQSLTIMKVKYSGTVTNPAGLPTGTYCSLFIAEAKLQGSAVLNSGQDIQYLSGNLVQVRAIATHDGTPPVADQTVARDTSIIPGKGVLMDLDQVGTSLLANDTGGDIIEYRIDLYKGAGKAVCAGYNNIMAVGACTPATSDCPASAVQ